MRGRVALARAGLIAFGLVLTVILLELALQIGSLFVADRALTQSRFWATGNRRILCLGDSNTYGVRLKNRERDAYPPQLERFWNEGERARAEVLNLGYPGTNSSRLLGSYAEFLEALAPDLVIVLVGVNDFWTQPTPLKKSMQEKGLWSFVKRHSRLYSGFYMLLRRQSAAGDLEVQVTQVSDRGIEAGDGVIRVGEHSFELGWRADSTRGLVVAEADLRRNLRALTELSASSPAQLVLMTYPARWEDYYRLANRAIRAVAGERGVPLIDLEQVFRPLCPGARCEEYFYRDQHPTAAGYQRVAQEITRQLQELLR